MGHGRLQARTLLRKARLFERPPHSHAHVLRTELSSLATIRIRSVSCLEPKPFPCYGDVAPQPIGIVCIDASANLTSAVLFFLMMSSSKCEIFHTWDKYFTIGTANICWG